MRTRPWLACVVLAASLAAAGGEKSRKDAAREKEAEKASAAVARIALAQDLAAQGRKNSPLVLLAAAEILGQIDVPVRELAAQPEVSGKGGKEEEVAPLLKPDEEARLLVTEARDLANRLLKKGELTQAAATAVQALAREVVIKAPRGATGGVKRKNGWLAPGQTHTYRIAFDGWALARVFAASEGRSPLEVTVLDTAAKVRGEDAGWHPSATWKPSERTGGLFLIRITNVGDFGTPYRLLTN
jgi:hypothetical protein